MSEQKHTPGPWRVGDAGATVFGPPNGNPSPETVATVRKAANARRIVACVNACEGISTEVLEQVTGSKLAEHLTQGKVFAKVRQQRDDLLAALNAVLPYSGHRIVNGVCASDCEVCAAIAKCK